MFPFGSVPPLVGVPGQLLAPAAAVPPLPVPPLPLPYQLPVVSPPPPLLPLVLHPPPPLLLQPPLRHAGVKSPVTAGVLGSPCVTKSANAVKTGTAAPAAKAPPPAKEAGESAAVALGPACQQAEDKCEAAVKRETGSKIEANGSVPGEVSPQSERCEKPSRDKKEKEEVVLPADVSSTGSPKMKDTKHVMILDEDRKLCVELSLEEDGTLSPGLLRRHFPGVCGLTYRSPDCPHRQWVALEGGRLRAPRGGWRHGAYYCVFSEQSGGRWLHTFCHCSLSKPSKGGRAKHLRKSPSRENGPARRRANGLSSKKAQNEEPDVYVVEDTGEGDGRRCSPLVVCSLPQWVTEQRLREHFVQFGAVLTCAVQKDLVGGRYGVVEFRDLPAQEAALAEVFHRFGDTWCSVRLRC